MSGSNLAGLQGRKDIASVIRATVSCEQAARWLGLKGSGPARVCPICGHKSVNASLLLAQEDFCCHACNVQGDVIRLVQLVKHCTDQQAVAFIEEQLGKYPAAAPASPAAPSPPAPEANAAPSSPLLAPSGGRSAPSIPRAASGRYTAATASTPATPASLGGPSSGSPSQGNAARFALSTSPASTADAAQIYSDFLECCQPIPPDVMHLLRGWGIDIATTLMFRLRFSFPGYRKAMMQLGRRYGRNRLIASGLIREAKADKSTGTQAMDPHDNLPMVYGCFEGYRHAKISYLVLPYLFNGQPVYLKAKPLLDSTTLETHRLPESLATSESPPVFYNIDAAMHARHIMIVRREFDAIAASKKGVVAVAASRLADIRLSWLAPLAGKTVTLVLDEHWKRDPLVAGVLRMLDQSGVAAAVTAEPPDGIRGLKLARWMKSQLAAQGADGAPQMAQSGLMIALDDSAQNKAATAGSADSSPVNAATGGTGITTVAAPDPASNPHHTGDLVSHDEPAPAVARARSGGSNVPGLAPDVPHLGPRQPSGQFASAGDADEDDVPALAEDIPAHPTTTDQVVIPSGSGLMGLSSDAVPDSSQGRVSTPNQFIATVPLDLDEAIVVEIVPIRNQDFLQCQNWSCRDGDWMPQKEPFLLPMRKAHQLLAAINGAIQGRPTQEKPEWLDSI